MSKNTCNTHFTQWEKKTKQNVHESTHPLGTDTTYGPKPPVGSSPFSLPASLPRENHSPQISLYHSFAFEKHGFNVYFRVPE